MTLPTISNINCVHQLIRILDKTVLHFFHDLEMVKGRKGLKKKTEVKEGKKKSRSSRAFNFPVCHENCDAP